MHEPCEATNRDGSPCGARARPGSRYCPWHDPALAGERDRWRRNGGAGRSRASRAAKRLPPDLRDVQASLLRALRAVEAGELEPQRASAMSALARTILTVMEHGAMELRIQELERIAGIEEAAR